MCLQARFVGKHTFTSRELYSQGSNTDHSKTESIRKPNIFKFCIGMFGFRMVGSIDVYSYSYGTDHLKTEHLETYKMAALA